MRVHVNVSFHYGAGDFARAGSEIELDDADARLLALNGRVTILEAPAAPVAPPAAAVNLSRMNRADLVAHAAQLGVAHAEDATRAQIIAAIEAATA